MNEYAAVPGRWSDTVGVGPLELLSVPIRRWRFLAAFVFGVSLFAAAAAFVLPKRYMASASFVADPGRGTELSGSLASLMGRVGLGDVGVGASTPQFYADLLRSRAVLRRVLRAIVPTDSGNLPVMDVLGVRDRDSLRRVERGEQTLSRRLTVRLDRVTGRVDLSVWMPHAVTAQAVADTLLSLLDQYNREIRRSRATEKRAFADAQAQTAVHSLVEAERAMELFLERNRSFAQSAQLQFQHERLARAIALRQDMYLELARQAEGARIEEVDTRPVITVVDRPVRPAKAAFPRRRVMVMGSAAMALFLMWSAMVIIQLYHLASSQSGSDIGRAIAVVHEAFGRRSGVSSRSDPGVG